MLRRSRNPLRITTIGAILLGALGTAGAMALSHSAPPVPRIVSGPGHRTLSRTATFTFTDTQLGLRLRCSINGRRFRACHSPVRYTGLPLGANAFRVQAQTRSGATSPWARYAWTVRPLPPGLAVAAPVAGRYYNAAGWAAVCAAGGGVCGTLRVGNGRPRVVVSLRQLSTGHYWDGRGYAATRAVWMRATLQRAHGGHRTWIYRLAALARDGGYTVSVRSFSRLQVRIGGHRRSVIGQRAHAAVTFTIDTVGPAAPAIVSAPPSPSSVSTASVRFSDASAPVVFECSLDGSPAATCSSPAVYTGLAAGTHRFSVWAIDEAGNRSPATMEYWQQASASGPSAPFTIRGQAAGPLYPGGSAQAVALTLDNPGAETIYVTSLGVTLQVSRLPPGCSSDGFAIREPSLPAAGVVVPARSTVTLSTPALGAASMQMIDTGTDQDPCQNATLALAFTGTAHS